MRQLFSTVIVNKQYPLYQFNKGDRRGQGRREGRGEAKGEGRREAKGEGRREARGEGSEMRVDRGRDINLDLFPFHTLETFLCLLLCV